MGLVAAAAVVVVAVVAADDEADPGDGGVPVNVSRAAPSATVCEYRGLASARSVSAASTRALRSSTTTRSIS